MGDANSTPTFFTTWSALQSHIRISHPPTCLYPSCNGRTFVTQGNLRAHIKLHDDTEAELLSEATQHLGENDDEPLKKKRRGGDQGRDWQCDVPGCDKDFKSVRVIVAVVLCCLRSLFNIRKGHWRFILMLLISENVILSVITPTATRLSAINISSNDIWPRLTHHKLNQDWIVPPQAMISPRRPILILTPLQARLMPSARKKGSKVPNHYAVPIRIYKA